MISTNAIISQILILETSHFCARTVTKAWGHADWSRSMFKKSTENGNGMMVVQFCFSLSHRSNFLETFKGNGLKKTVNDSNFPQSIILLLTIEMASKCSKLCSETTPQ